MFLGEAKFITTFFSSVVGIILVVVGHESFFFFNDLRFKKVVRTCYLIHKGITKFL